jgi:hypothetical protein
MVLLAAALFALGLPAVAAASTVHAARPAVLASTCGSEPGDQETYWISDDNLDGYYLHAHAFNQPVSTITVGNQTFYTCNRQRWTNPAGQIVNVAEVNLVGGDSCLNWVASNDTFYLDSCQAGNKDELFQLANDGGCGTCEWLVAVQASDNVRSDQYFTADGLYNGSPVVAASQGEGGLAEWAFDCATNCPPPAEPAHARLLPALWH